MAEKAGLLRDHTRRMKGYAKLMTDPPTPTPDDEPDHDTVYIIPDWLGERIALICEAWAKAGRMFKIEGELLDRLTAEAKRRTDGA